MGTSCLERSSTVAVGDAGQSAAIAASCSAAQGVQVMDEARQYTAHGSIEHTRDQDWTSKDILGRDYSTATYRTWGILYRCVGCRCRVRTERHGSVR